MSKYLMNKLIHLVNMNEEAEKEYKANAARIRREVGENPEAETSARRTRSAGDQRLWQTIRARRAPVYSLELHRGRMRA